MWASRVADGKCNASTYARIRMHLSLCQSKINCCSIAVAAVVAATSQSACQSSITSIRFESNDYITRAISNISSKYNFNFETHKLFTIVYCKPTAMSKTSWINRNAAVSIGCRWTHEVSERYPNVSTKFIRETAPHPRESPFWKIAMHQFATDCVMQ